MPEEANSTPAPLAGAPPKAPLPPRRRRWGLTRLRPWVQTGFTALWLSPLGLSLMWLPGCVFHCYGCPLATFACPVGVVGQFAGLHLVPVLAIGILVAVGASLGTLVCGWACPFGFMQDLLAKLPLPKVMLPNRMGLGRYVVLIGLVLLVPYLWGVEHPLFICKVCPVGALESRLAWMPIDAYHGREVIGLGWTKGIILGTVLAAALFVHRPWCAVLCPLGGFFALFNRASVFFLRFNPQQCTECNLCRSRCKYGVKVDQAINGTSCIRCLECTACPAIKATAAPVRLTVSTTPAK